MFFISMIAHTFKFSLGLVSSFVSIIGRSVYIMVVGVDSSSRPSDDPSLAAAGVGVSSGQLSNQPQSLNGGHFSMGGGGAFGLLPDLEETPRSTQMRPFGLSGIAEQQDEQSELLGQELVLPEVDAMGAGDESVLKTSTGQKG